VTTPHLAGHPAASQQAIVDAALLMLQQMGLSPDDLVTAPRDRPPVPTFAEYLPVVSAAVTDGTRRAYGSYWNRIIDHWGERRLDEPTPSEIRQLMSYVKTHVVARRNARGGRSATEHLVAALRCLYKHAEDDGLITPVRTPPGRWTSPAACRRPAGPSPTTGSPRSARPPRPAATIQSWTRCCSGCTPRPPAAAAGRSRCGPMTSTPASA
jgi:integrase/recombinase XerC